MGGVDTGHRVRDYCGNILTKQMAVFCLLSKNLSEAKLNSNRLISSADISGALMSGDLVMWLLVINIMGVK